MHNSISYFLLPLFFSVICWGKHYDYQNYTSILQQMTDLSTNYERYCKLIDVQDEYDHLIDTKCGDSKCKYKYLQITDFNASSSQINALPQALYIGGIHGDEPLGPNIVIGFAEYLLKNAESNATIQHIIRSRLLLLLPMANPSGFYVNKLEEQQSTGGITVNPSQDFPYKATEDQCLRSSASRVINHLFKKYTIQAALVFQGNQQEAIGYPWGASNHIKDGKAQEAPDNQVFSDVAKAMASEAGVNPFLFIGPYTTGRIGDKIGALDGGIADWAYAGSWEPSAMSKCGASSENDTIPESTTEYPDSSLRALVYVVQPSKQKRPNVAYLGSKEGVDQHNYQYGYGYIPMNIRLSLALADVLEPYVTVKEINIKKDENIVIVRWQGGGCKTVDDTGIEWIHKEGRNTYTTLVQSQRGPGYYDNPNFFFEEALPINGSDFNLTSISFRLTCDQGWMAQNSSVQDKVPQTHLPQVRSNDSYSVNANGYKIVGKKVAKLKVDNITQSYFEDEQNLGVDEVVLMMEIVPCDGSLNNIGVLRTKTSRFEEIYSLLFTGKLKSTVTGLEGHLHQYGDITKCDEDLSGKLANIETLIADEKYAHSHLFSLKTNEDQSLEVNSTAVEFDDQKGIFSLIGRSVTLQTEDDSSYIGHIVPVQPDSCKKDIEMRGCFGIDLGYNEGVCIVRSTLPEAKAQFNLYIQPQNGTRKVKVYGFVPNTVMGIYNNTEKITIVSENSTNDFAVNYSVIIDHGLIEQNTLEMDPKFALGNMLRIYTTAFGDKRFIGSCSIGLNNPSYNQTESYIVYTKRRSFGIKFLIVLIVVLIVYLVVKKWRSRKDRKSSSPKDIIGRVQLTDLPGKHVRLQEASDDEQI